MTNNSIKFWEETLAFSVKEPSFDKVEFKKAMGRYKMMMRKMKIIATTYFLEHERLALQILSESALPAADISSVLGLCQPETYRFISYVKVLLREYYSYFEKKSYKQLEGKLYDIILFEVKQDAGRRLGDVKKLEERADKLFSTLYVYAIFRDPKVVARIVRYSPMFIKRVIDRLDGILKKYASYDTDIRDLFVVWRRVRKIRKTAFGWYEKFLTKEYIEHGGKVIASIRKGWVRGRR